MHQYLRAVGFDDPPRRIELFNIIKEGITRKSIYRAYTSNMNEEDSLLAQFDVPLARGIGISVCGQFDDGDEFFPEYHYPYLNADRVSSTEPIEIDRRIDHEAYSGMVIDGRFGAPIVYRVRNSIELIKRMYESLDPLEGATTRLSALSLEGRILLPLYKSPEEEQHLERVNNTRRMLCKEAMAGDEQAMKAISMSDMETIQNIVERVSEDDLYAMIDTSMIPSPGEMEEYYVVGEIRSVRRVHNRITHNKVVIMNLVSNSVWFNVAINSKDLMGEPAVGRRFKGKVWMQGRIEFAD